MHCNFSVFVSQPLVELLCQIYDLNKLIAVDFPPIEVRHHFLEQSKSDNLVSCCDVQQGSQVVHALSVANLWVILGVCIKNVENWILSAIKRDVMIVSLCLVEH